jgi:O-acetylserine/cysteine efflux transporter
VFFTIGLSLLTLGERVRGFQLVGLLLALAGLAVIASHLDATLTLKGLVLVLAAAFFWSCANMVVKTVGRVDMLGFMVWTSLFAVPPPFALSWWLEGPTVMAASVMHASASVWACVLWQALGNTLFGYLLASAHAII